MNTDIRQINRKTLSTVVTVALIKIRDYLKMEKTYIKT